MIKNCCKNFCDILRGKEKFTGRHLLILGAFFVFVAVFSAWSVSYTSASEFCVTCHEMTTYHEIWTTSAHKNVECIECHGKPGLEGTIETKANGMRQAYLHLTQNEFNPKAPVNDVNCLSCHQDKVNTNTDQALARKNPHTVKHFENGMNCLSCHTGVVHDVKVNTVVPSRDTCSSCHLDQMNL